MARCNELGMAASRALKKSEEKTEQHKKAKVLYLVFRVISIRLSSGAQFRQLLHHTSSVCVQDLIMPALQRAGSSFYKYKAFPLSGSSLCRHVKENLKNFLRKNIMLLCEA